MGRDRRHGRPGAESRHNTRYWLRRPYLGIGPSAASHAGRLRWTESPILPAWVEGRGETERQELDDAEDLAELPLLGFRRHEGVDWQAVRAEGARRNLSPLVDSWEAAIAPCFRAGLVVADGPRWRLTSKGMLLGNAVFQIFV